MRAFGALRRVATAPALPRAASRRRPALCFSSSSLSSSPTFVSSHFQLDDPLEIPAFLERKRLAFRASDSHLVVKECPFCHATRGKADNLFKLYVHRRQGVFKCHRCGAAGSWFDFKRALQSPHVALAPAGAALHGNGSTMQDAKVIAVLDNAKAMAIQRNLTEDPAFAPVRAYLTQRRGLSEHVLAKYGVGAIEQPFRNDAGESESVACIAFPWMARAADLDAMGVVVAGAAGGAAGSGDRNQFDVVRLKLRGVDDKSKQRLVPKGGSWGLFGWHTVPAAAEELVVTEGEFDAMAVHQATGLPAVSLPNGCQSLPPAVLPLLERFKKIYLWLDNDAAGQANVDKFAAKLGVARCLIVRAPPGEPRVKDANDALLAGLDLRALVAAAEILPHSQITTFDELRRDVLEEIVNPLRACGVQSRTLPSLNALLKGHRLGEVTVLTGPTGCGKTTLLSQLSLDLCAQGVSTLWGSFEIKNTRLLHKMLTQLAGRSLRGDVRAFEAVADKFEALPMYFLRFFGSTDVDEVLDAMEYAVYAYDVQHVLLDNVQFMMAGQGRGYDKFERQDAALDKFRRFASQQNVHVTLVIHPRKEQEDVDLTLSSVFGTAKATQEADNVLILQRTRGANKLDVRKNRFDGTLGSIPLVFDADAGCYREPHEPTVDEHVAAIHLEAEMQLQQKVRRQQQQQQEHRIASPPTASERDAPAMRPARFVYCEDERHDSAEDAFAVGERLVNGLHSLNGAAAHVNGSSRSGSNDSDGGGSGRNGEPFAAFTPIITR
ncbi:hypothetical protein ATCC90586_009898 [Pythium insidiosum]|nr:hypothetical protein ATCC90586_009898 [Pythium insidiosum]